MTLQVCYKEPQKKERDSPLWNLPARCEGRLKTVKELVQLLANGGALTVPDISKVMPKADLDEVRLNQDWSDSTLVAEVYFVPKGENVFHSGMAIQETQYHFVCKVRPHKTVAARKWNELQEPGDFIISVDELGKLLGFDVADTRGREPLFSASYMPDTSDGMDTVAQIEKLDDDVPKDDKSRAADCADIVLLMLLQRGRLIEQPSRSPGRQ